MKYSCYYIIHLGCLWTLFNTFILILGLTYWPRAKCQFLFFPLFQCFEEKEYQTESKWNETFWRSYVGKKSNPGDLESTSRKQRGRHKVEGHDHPPGRALHPRGPLVAPMAYFFRLYISIYPKTMREHNRSGVPPPEASVATGNQSRPVPAHCRRGQSFPGGHLHHPGALHDKEGVVLPWG